MVVGEDLAPGKYEYWDGDGNPVVKGDDCYLILNAGDEERGSVKLKSGQPFSIDILTEYNKVRLEPGRYDVGCTGILGRNRFWTLPGWGCRPTGAYCFTC